MSELWSSFPHDPRAKANAPLRASDADRDRISGVLSAAFADGRLERDEFDERSDAVSTARTLGELVPIVGDLVPVKPTPTRTSRSLVDLGPEQLHAAAVEQWSESRRNALYALLGSSVLFWGIWLATGADSFPWPAIVTLLALLRVARVVSSRDQIVRDEVRRLEKKQARQERWPKGLA